MRAGRYACRMVIGGAPVGNREPVKSPVIPQDFLQQMFIFIGIHAVDPVIGGHDRSRSRFLYRDLKAGQIDFPQCPFIHHGVACHTAQLLGICGKMLRARAHAFGLDPADVACRHFPGQIGILAEIFKVPAAQRASLDIHSRPQQYADILGGSFHAQMLPDLFPKPRIPAVGDRSRRGIAGGRQAPIEPQLVACSLLLPDSVGAVSQSHIRNPQTFYRTGLPKILS